MSLAVGGQRTDEEINAAALSDEEKFLANG